MTLVLIVVNKKGDKRMSKQYDLYLEQHRGNVAKGFYWIQENLPELLINVPGELIKND